jgi:hypothetical protein
MTMSKFLFALSLNTLLHVLEQKLTAIRISRRSKKTAVVIYADITNFVTVPEDISAIRDAKRTYERATDAMLNIRKYKALTIGARDTTMT